MPRGYVQTYIEKVENSRASLSEKLVEALVDMRCKDLKIKDLQEKLEQQEQ